MQTRYCTPWNWWQSFNITKPPNVTRTLRCSKRWFISRSLWTQSLLFLRTPVSTWFVNRHFLHSNLDESIFCSILSHIGVCFLSVFFAVDGVSMFLLYHRGCPLPRRAILAKHCLARRNRHYCVDRAVFLNLSLLEDVGNFCFHLEPAVQCIL